jgi:surface protein
MSLETVPLFISTNVTDMDNMFESCRSLRALPTFDTAKVTSMNSMLSGCMVLSVIPAWNVTLVTSFSQFLQTGYSISRVLMTNIKVNISFNQQMMGWAELDELYNNLPTVTAKTLTINDNWGYQASNTALATAKGWTLTDLYYSSVKLLLHFDGTNGQTTTTDNSGTPKTITRAGTITLSTAQPKFGTASTASEASTANGWTVADSADWSFGSSQTFTVEADVYYTTVPGGSDDACIVAQWGTNSQRSWFLGHLGGVFGLFYSTTGSNTLSVSAAWTPTVNTHYHVAADRDVNGVIRVYVNGVVLASATVSSAFQDSTAVLQIGGGAGANSLVGMIGYIDEVRVTKLVPRYSGAFRPPSAPYLNA